jgi:hypothetical protein
VKIIIDTIVKILWSLMSGPNKGESLGVCDELSFEI